MHRLADFTTELLTFSRGVTPSPTRLDLKGFVRKIVDSFRAHADALGSRLEMRGSDEPLPVDADLSLVHVVLSNLIANALDFAPGDGRGVVTVETRRAGTECIVRVSDNGPGVSENVKPRLFEPFVTGRTNGVGIGLALSRRIARAHGGDVRLVDSTEGACFELILPGVSA
jgi:signal transduction histidine kinase